MIIEFWFRRIVAYWFAFIVDEVGHHDGLVHKSESPKFMNGVLFDILS
jgi:hypothetical protein